MTQANNRQGQGGGELVPFIEGGAAPRLDRVARWGGTESNRARAARGAHGPDVLSVYLDGQRIAGAPREAGASAADHGRERQIHETAADMARAGFCSYDEARASIEAMLAPRLRALGAAEVREVFERVVGVDHAAGPDFTGRTRMTVREDADGARRWEAVDPPRPSSVAWSGEVPAPVVSLPATLAEAERLYGKGSPVWEDASARVLAGVAPAAAPTDPGAAYRRAFVMAGPQPLFSAPPAAPQPDPAPGQVWLPPPGSRVARNAMKANPDGTLTVQRLGVRALVAFEGDILADVTDLADPARGWTCVGVATPHGRVMVGDGFALSDGHRVSIIEVAHHGVVECAHSGGGAARWDADDLAREATRTRYAPARAGERYRNLGTGDTAHIERVIADGRLIAMVKNERRRGGMITELPTNGRLDPAQWERLDGGAAQCSDDAHRDGQTIRIKRPASVVEAERARAVGAADAETDVALRDRCITADWRRAAKAPGLDTATGATLDAIAATMGIERRAAVQPSGVATDALGRELAFDYGGNIKGPPSVDYDVATKTITRLHLRAGQTFVSGRRPDLQRFTLTRRVETIPSPETWATEEGPYITEDFAREACRFVGMKADLLAAAAGVVLRAVPEDAPSTLTLQAPARDLRALFDAVGRALESAVAHGAVVGGKAILVKRDEMLFAPEVQVLGGGASIQADTKHLHALRALLLAAMTGPPGVDHAGAWGKERIGVVVRREYRFEPAPTAERDPAPTRYDGANGGADAWRWGGDGQ